jgi:hypothetical protein
MGLLFAVYKSSFGENLLTHALLRSIPIQRIAVGCKERVRKEILREVSTLERTGVEGYREVSVYTGVYQEGRGAEAISPESSKECELLRGEL